MPTIEEQMDEIRRRAEERERERVKAGAERLRRFGEDLDAARGNPGPTVPPPRRR